MAAAFAAHGLSSSYPRGASRARSYPPLLRRCAVPTERRVSEAKPGVGSAHCGRPPDDPADPRQPTFVPPANFVLDPVPDAALGTLAYATEIVLSLIGGEDRWRTAPRAVPDFGFVILSGALVSVALVLVKPLVVGAWCTLCLASAAVSFAVFAP